MPGMITTVFVFLAVFALVLAVAAIGWLARVSKRLSALGRRVLESEEIERIRAAADKTASFESRMAGCENKTTQSQNQLADHETKLRELAANLGATEQMANRNGTGLAGVSEKMSSFESRLVRCENRAEQSQDQLVDHEKRGNELATKLGSVEQMADNIGADLAEANRSIKALADEIQSLRKFQTATQKACSLILAAFPDMRANVPPEEGLGTTPETATPEESSQAPQEGQKEIEDQKSGAYHYP